MSDFAASATRPNYVASLAVVFHGWKLEAEKDLFMHLDVPDLDHKRPFHYGVAERKPFTFTTESARVSIQTDLLTICLREGGQLRTLEG